MKQIQISIAAALLAAVFTPGVIQAEVLLREEFDGYAPGPIHNQAGQGIGLTSGTWDYYRGSGSMTIGTGLSGANGLVIDADGGDNDLRIDHTVAGWGTGQLWMSFLYNESSYGGHFYVAGSGGFEGGAGHGWWGGTTLGLHNTANPGAPYTQNQTYRLVVLWDWNAGSTAFWVDPDPGTPPVTDPLDVGFAPDAYMASEAPSPAIQQLRIASYDTDGIVDDIIVGPTYAEGAIGVPVLPPPAPHPVVPTDTAANVLLDAVLQWTSVSADSWDVYLWKNSEAKPGTPTAVGLASPSYDPFGLEPVEDYNWEVVAYNAHGSTPGSSSWTFGTSDGVVPVAPVDGASDVPLHAQLEWSDIGATSWNVFVWKQTDPEPGTPTASGLGSPAYSPAVLSALTDYNWKVVSVGSPLGTTTSITWSFTTDEGATPLSPASGATGAALGGQLQWSDDGAATWDVYLWKAADTEPGTPTSAGLTSTAYGFMDLDTLTEYFWKVVSHSAQGTTTSATFSFTTEDGLPGVLLLHEEFDGYAPGSIIGQDGMGMGLTGAWSGNGNGDYQIAAGLSGATALASTAGPDNNLQVSHTVSGWGSGQMWMSFLYNETSYGGHTYLSGGGSFDGGAGHGWWGGGLLGLHNQANPGAPYTAGDTVRIVTLIDWNANTTTMWVDPVDNPVAAGTPFVAQKAEVPSANQVLYFSTYNTVGTFDDIRIGTKFDVVTQEIVSTIDLSVDLVGMDLVFTWNGQPGVAYDLVSSTTLDTAPDTWGPVGSYVNMTADMSPLAIPFTPEPRRFYAIIGHDPVPLLDEDFEADDGGFDAPTIGGTTTGTLWEWGVADSNNELGVAVAGNCWAVGLGTYAGGPGDGANEGFYAVPTTTYLRSSPIDLTGVSGATLSFAEAIDADVGDVAEVYVIDGSDAVIGTGSNYAATDGFLRSENWAAANDGNPIDLPAAAMGQTVRIEWRFTGAGFRFIGWYIDDVVVTPR